MSFMSISWPDLIFMVLGLYFIIRGCFRGLTGEIITLAGFLCSIYVSFHYSGCMAEVLTAMTSLNITVAQVVSIFIIWFLMSFLIVIIKKLCNTILRAISLGGLDKILGILSGTLKTILSIYIVLITGFLLTPVIAPTWMGNSTCLINAGRYWPTIRRTVIQMHILPGAEDIPGVTLEEYLRPYRTGTSEPVPYSITNQSPFEHNNVTDNNIGNKVVI